MGRLFKEVVAITIDGLSSFGIAEDCSRRWWQLPLMDYHPLVLQEKLHVQT